MLNRIVLMGRLVSNPELRHTQNGLSVTSFTLAVNRDFARAGEERSTDFIDVVAWRASADFAAKYFSKGQLVAVDGSLQTRTYQDKNGVNRKAFEVVADKLHFAEKKRESYTSGDDFMEQNLSNEQNNGASDFASPSSDMKSVSEQTRKASFDSKDLGFTELPTEDDDLPF